MNKDEDEEGDDGELRLPKIQLPYFSLNGSLTQSTKPMGSKICRWVQNDGTVCGKAFSKLDSLRRHVNELHKGVRPFACSQCEKSYGRQDYLERHVKTHEKKARQAEAEARREQAAAAGLDSWGPNGGILLDGDEPLGPAEDEVKKSIDKSHLDERHTL